METKTMCTKTGLLSDLRFAHSSSPTLAGISASTQGSSVSVVSMVAAEYSRERSGNVPFFGTDVENPPRQEVTVSI